MAYVVVHVAVSLEGATVGFEPDIGRFYELAQTWQENVTLTGADTILAQENALAAAHGPGPAKDGPLLAVVDSRARVRQWEALRNAGHWSEVLALHAKSTPARSGGAPAQKLVVGNERVDLPAALRSLGERDGVRVVRVDSGGSLTGALLAASLIDEVSLLIHPHLMGTRGGKLWHGEAAVPADLEMLGNETFDGGLVWLRYRIVRR